ncbi:MAG: orotidine-5'-phosphate decarboxylase [Candidatus Rokuibacteriota bacterium]
MVALDVESLTEASALLDRLHGVVRGCKIGSQLFTAAGPAAIELARKRGVRVFLDLKFHDIPNTVAGAVREATRLGVFMLNVHASGGLGMMRAAAQSAARAAQELGVPRPLCLAVTVLTSLDRRALDVEVGVPATVEAQVLHLARLAQEAELDGCVASPREAALLRQHLGTRWVIVTPGIRGTVRESDVAPPRESGSSESDVAPPRELGSSESDVAPPRELGGPGGHVGAPRSNDDHSRIATPAAALRAGADFLVVGRPITAAPDPAAAARAILAECSAG